LCWGFVNRDGGKLHRAVMHSNHPELSHTPLTIGMVIRYLSTLIFPVWWKILRGLPV
jgi:hypothetical protein